MDYTMNKSGILLPNKDNEIVMPDFTKVGEALDLNAHLKEMAKWLKMYVGFTPDEGETLNAQVQYQRIHADRDATLELGLFTDVTPDETITEATITEPTGTGYARIVLTDASWAAVAGIASYAEQTFTGGAGGWTGNIQGYFISSVSSGGTKRLLVIEVDGNGPYVVAENDTYKITPNIAYTGA